MVERARGTLRRDWRWTAAGRGPHGEAPGLVRRQGRKSGPEPFLWFLWEETVRQGQQACSAGEVFSGSGQRGCPSRPEPALGALAQPCPGTDQLSRVRGPRCQNVRKQTIKRCGEQPCPERPRKEGLACVALLGPRSAFSESGQLPGPPHIQFQPCGGSEAPLLWRFKASGSLGASVEEHARGWFVRHD